MKKIATQVQFLTTNSASVAHAILESNLLVLFIIFEPEGVYGRWLKLRNFFENFPFYRRNTFKRQKTYLRTDRLK